MFHPFILQEIRFFISLERILTYTVKSLEDPVCHYSSRRTSITKPDLPSILKVKTEPRLQNRFATSSPFKD